MSRRIRTTRQAADLRWKIIIHRVDARSEGAEALSLSRARAHADEFDTISWDERGIFGHRRPVEQVQIWDDDVAGNAVIWRSAEAQYRGPHAMVRPWASGTITAGMITAQTLAYRPPTPPLYRVVQQQYGLGDPVIDWEVES